jgi:hypothetical protein
MNRCVIRAVINDDDFHIPRRLAQDGIETAVYYRTAVENGYTDRD